MPISEIKQIFSISLIRDMKPFPLQICSGGDFSYISHANIPEKAGLRKRQEKTHHILGSLRPTLLAFTKYSRESCPVASHANHSLPLPRQIPEPQRNAAHTFYFSSPQYTAGLTAETLVICHYNFCIYLQKTN